jgi:hypothetical protein
MKNNQKLSTITDNILHHLMATTKCTNCGTQHTESVSMIYNRFVKCPWCHEKLDINIDPKIMMDLSRSYTLFYAELQAFGFDLYFQKLP